MAVLLTPFFIQFEDDLGNPISGGKVYTYAAGSTSTKKATFTDFTETVQAANPIILDAAGRATIWINGSYKFVLTDANNVPIRSTDNVTSFSVPDASNPAFFQSFSGNNAQTVFLLSADLGTDENAVLAFVDQGTGKGYDIQRPNAFTLTSGLNPSIAFATPPAAGALNIYVFAPSLLLGAASAAAAAAATSETNAAASAAAAAVSEANSMAAAAALNGTSATSFTIGAGSKVFTTQANKKFSVGAFITIASAANVNNFMFGQITDYTGTALTVNVTAAGGSGTFADWLLSIAGAQGISGGAVSNGTYGDIVVTGGGTIWTVGNLAITAAKIAAATITYAKIATAAIAALSDVVAGTIQKFVTSDVLRTYLGAWVSYTPTITHSSGAYSNGTLQGQWRRVGDSIEIRGGISFTGASAAFSGFFVSLPTGLTIDATKLPNGGTLQSFGTGFANGGGVQCPLAALFDIGNVVTISPYDAGFTYLRNVPLTNTGPVTQTTGTSISWLFKAPIVGW